ncbi:MAG: NAD(P)/FAD-dependent oxidoreductase [Planctomycetes bacterium]|nr:NAD(P)/FAD-dependent oxidoreductase [Planctomycetota bacterium]
MSGLAAAIRLAMFDRRVVVLERHDVWGGLNSFYQFRGHQFDVGLHAMTNWAPRGAKGLPLSRLLKQLRIRHEELDLHPQGYSAVSFPGARLRFSNDFELLRSEVARAFPAQADGFDALTRAVRGFNELDLEAPQQDARPVVRRFITDPLLQDMLFCPLMFYGSAREHDMDWDQFVVMFKSIFLEGFARPAAGVRHILKLLIRRLREAGAELRLRTGVSRLLVEDGAARGVVLDNGETLMAGAVLSSAGLVETQQLAGGASLLPGQQPQAGRLSFTESISVLDCPARNLGIEETIVFYSDRLPFAYEQPRDDVDVSSGVICMPGNFDLPEPPRDHLVRITNMADHGRWAALGHGPEYSAAKQRWYAKSCAAAVPHIADFRPHVTLVDTFTPRTIRRFTGHAGGAVYGSPRKLRTGRTGIDNLYLIGTDQGFLGIVGAALSGISMANRWVLQGSGE